MHFKQFGRYEIIRKLGRSMTDVYLALDPEANRRVVLKIVEHSHDPYTQLVIDAEERGATIQKQLHTLDPRILEIYDFGEEAGCFFVAMEYVEGKSLSDTLRVEQRLDAKRAARYAMEICSQLQTLHSFQADIDGRMRAVVHGDVKPSNIQIGPNDEARLLDFGIAKFITSTHNLTHHNMGSPAYCSPERVKNVQVDQHADLWGLGVSLYEMIAGLPPYQAQSTRKLENLIQSRRPPRALPQDCPPAMKDVISKALAADLERRYESALAFAADLKLFLDDQPTAAEAGKQPAWHANATVERAPPPRPAPLLRKQKLQSFFAKASPVLWTLLAGFLVGLVLFIPAGYVYRLWTQSAPLRGPRDYVRRSLPEMESDWWLYQWTRQQSRFLGRFAPASAARESLHASFAGAANEIIERYRNSSQPAIENFDWGRAQVCLNHALDLDPGDKESRGKLALCKGYAQLVANPKSMEAAQKADANFAEAMSYLPRSPDPHLGVARLEIYTFHNVGRALAEFYEAERLGFRLGPREMEQQADGYLYRAEQEIRQWQKSSKLPQSERTHLLSLAQRDLSRARNLYEPIGGFSNVSLNLQKVYFDETRQQQMQAALAATKAKPKVRRARASRWR